MGTLQLPAWLKERWKSVSHLGRCWWRTFWVAYQRFGYGAGYILAAALAFYAVICLGPLGILLAWTMQLVLGSQGEAYAQIQALLDQMGEVPAERIMNLLNDLLQNPDSYVAGVVSLVALLWAGHRLFETVERSLTEVWPGKQLRGILGRKLMALGMMLVSGLMLGLLLLLEFVLSAVRGWLAQFDNQLTTEILPDLPLLVVVQIAVGAFAYFLLYKYVPVQRVPNRVAFVGGLFSALAWHAITPVFSFAISRSQQYDLIYGGLTGVVIFALWAFWGGWVLLFGAHFAAAYQHVFARQRPPETDQNFVHWHQPPTDSGPRQID
jgi:membrane protein